MRIQHNIPAMNSLSNYARNNNALAKNLEKLSSGYRINSAADDAAGLAISEKMRSQIAGLEKAQDNANDGISLVQVAEGALTEVNSMLTRLTELATQSANGTYEDAVDRANIQEETNAILSEIDRISKATNFNGINLLDGSMSSTGKVGAATEFSIPEDVGTLQADLGVKTILHASPAEKAPTKFSIDLNDFTFTNKQNESLEIELGANGVNGKITFKQTGTATALDGVGIAKLIADADGNNGDLQITPNGGTAANLDAGTVSIGGQDFKITADGSKITFEQKAAPNDDTQVVAGDMSVKITGAGTASNLDNANLKTGTEALANGALLYSGFDTNAQAAIKTVADSMKVDSGNVTLNYDGASNKFQLKVGTTVIAESAVENADLTAGKAITLTGKDAATTTITLTGALSVNAGQTETRTDLAAVITDLDSGLDYIAEGDASGGGSYNVSTVDITNGTPGGKNTLASTVINLKDMGTIANGSSVKIGETTYVFQVGSDEPKTSGENSKIVKLSDPTDLSDVATKLTDAAADNSEFSVGHNNVEGKLTIVEKEGQTKYTDLDTVEGIKAKFSYQGFEAPAEGAKALRLQVGETNDDWQHVSVDIQNMSSTGLGLRGANGTLDLSTQEAAGKAIDTIKNAVNAVSMQRGKLGALQNRLDHTLNNLDATTTNITASESQIRDVNMAKEMTAYTKNNILAQAAQSMLAQANSMPQGVLQLLQ